MKNRVPTPRDQRPLPPPFEAVPRRKVRHDGWTPDRQRAFIEALADTGSVSRAAAAVNMSAESAYQLRRQPGAESFRRAWDAALDFGVARLKDIALERAIEGDLVPVIAGGKLHGYRRVRNDRLLMFAIRMNDPAADGRRHAASYFQPRDGGTPASSVTVPNLTPAEALDANAAHLAAFTPVPLDPHQQAAIYESLAAEARRRADLPTAQDPDEPFLRPEELDQAGLGPLHSPHADKEWPSLPEGERPWDLLHDEAGAQAIDDAVEQVKAAKAAGYFDHLYSPQAQLGEGGSSAEALAKAERDPAPDTTPALEASSSAPPTPLLPKRPPDPPRRQTGTSPRTGEPVRAYKPRTPKEPFDPLDWRNYKE